MARKRCEFCSGLYKQVGTHQRSCKRKKKIDRKLEKEGILENEKGFMFSGGAKITLTIRQLGLKPKHDEDKRILRNIQRVERANKGQFKYYEKSDKIKWEVHNETTKNV